MNEMDNFGKRSVAFVLRIYSPLETLVGCMQFMQHRDITVESIQLHRIADTETAFLAVICKLERDKTQYTKKLLGKQPGIISLEMLEGKGFADT